MVAAGGLQSLIGCRHPEAFVDEADAVDEADDAYDPTEFIDEENELTSVSSATTEGDGNPHSPHRIDQNRRRVASGRQPNTDAKPLRW